MPQLDFAYFPSQIIWLLFSFAALYFFLKHLIIPKIENIITNRLIMIEKDTKDAAKLRDEAILLQEELAKKEQETHDRLAKMQADIITTFATEKEKHIKSISKNSTDSITKAIQEIDLAVKEAHKEIDSYITSHARSLITATTGLDPSIDDLYQSYKKMSKQ